MDIYKVLKEDHETVKKQLLEIITNDAREDESLKEIEKALQVHMEGEEEHFYPLMEDNEKSRHVILEAYEEHALAKEMLDKLANEDDDERWLAKVKVLYDLVDHHIEEEEDQIFKFAKAAIDKEQSKELAKIMTEAKRNEGIGEEDWSEEEEEEPESSDEDEDEEEEEE